MNCLTSSQESPVSGLKHLVHVITWSEFCQYFRTVFLPSDNQERVLRGILDRTQAPDEPLPTFVAHMLSEFNKLKSPPPEQEQVDLICKHSLEKYRVAIYGTPISSVMDLLLRAHELHAVLGPSSHQTQPARFRRNQNVEPYCFKCSRPGFTTRSCPSCNVFPPMPLSTTHPRPTPAFASPLSATLNAGEPRTESDEVSAETPPLAGRSENFRGGGHFAGAILPPDAN